jgi:hypothetical protein
MNQTPSVFILISTGGILRIFDKILKGIFCFLLNSFQIVLLPLKIVHQQNLYLLYPRDLVYGALVDKQLQNVFRYDSCIIFFVSTGNILSWIHMQLLNVFLLFLEGVKMKIIYIDFYWWNSKNICQNSKGHFLFVERSTNKNLCE